MVPRGLVVGANHRGEFLDLVIVPASEVRVFGPDGPADTWATLINARPMGAEQSVTANAATVTTAWKGAELHGPLALTETTVLHSDARGFEVIEQVAAAQPIGGIEMKLWPVRGATATVATDGGSVDLLFPQNGLERPHLRVQVLEGQGAISLGDDGLLTVRSASDRVHVAVTDLTAGDGISPVQLLDPAQLVDAYDVAAVLLIRWDPAFAAREQRMEDLGYRLGLSAGAYALMVRD
jgi:hypothetical protein